MDKEDYMFTSNLGEINDELDRLYRYEKLVQFIANDYYELSHDKVKWQHNDWYKRCRKLIEEDNEREKDGLV